MRDPFVEAQTFAELLERLYQTRFTGKIAINVLNGLPRSVELPGPRLELNGTGERKKVDKRSEVADALRVSG